MAQVSGSPSRQESETTPQVAFREPVRWANKVWTSIRAEADKARISFTQRGVRLERAGEAAVHVPWANLAWWVE